MSGAGLKRWLTFAPANDDGQLRDVVVFGGGPYTTMRS
jgi:hypothetical protein